MDSVKSGTSQVVLSTQNLLQEMLPAELHLQVINALIAANQHDAVAALGQTNNYWRQFTRAEHPSLKTMVALDAPEITRTYAYHQQIEKVVNANAPAFLARVLVEIKDRDASALAFTLNSLSQDSVTYLMLAARLGFTEVAEVLMSAGAKVTSLDPLHRSAVVWAYEGKHKRLAKLLLGSYVESGLAKTIDELPKEADAQEVSLAQSVAAGHVLVTRENLAKPGAVVTDDHLFDAAKSFMPAAIATLLLNHAPEIISSTEGATLQAIESMPDPVSWLRLVMNCEGNNLNKNTLLHATASAGKFPAFEYVFSKGEHAINHTDSEGKTFLYDAAMAGCVEALDMLLSAGADHTLGPANVPLLPRVVRRMATYASGYCGDYWSFTTPSAAHTSVANRLLTLQWPKADLNEALISAHALSAQIRGCTGAAPATAALVTLIESLQAKGASLSAPPQTPAPAKKASLMKRFMRKS